MIRLSIRRPIAVSMLYLAAALLGVAAWRNIPIELLPDTSLPRLTVNATWQGASPETMEAFVTSPLEAAIQPYRGKGYRWTEAAPTLEDVFIQLMGQSQDNIQ